MMYYVPTFRANCKLVFISTNNVCRLFNYRIRLFVITSDFAFFMNMIPFIGPWIAFAPALIVAVIQDQF